MFLTHILQYTGFKKKKTSVFGFLSRSIFTQLIQIRFNVGSTTSRIGLEQIQWSKSKRTNFSQLMKEIHSFVPLLFKLKKKPKNNAFETFKINSEDCESRFKSSPFSTKIIVQRRQQKEGKVVNMTV